MIVTPDQFKISCHSIGDIMSGEMGLTEVQVANIQELESRKNGVGKPLTPKMEVDLLKLQSKRDNPELPQGAKSFCKKWLKKKMFNRKEDWKAIVVEKGLQCEPMGIALVSKITGIEMSKNEDWFDNEYIQGTPDILTIDCVRDVKSSWDLFTFPMFDDEMPKKEYWWQLQGYMILLGLDKAALDYVLIDTPMPLVLLDLKKLYYQSGGKAEDWTPEKYEFLYPNYRFDDIPEEMRLKTFYFDKADWAEEQINARVIACRKYIGTLTNVTPK